MCALTRRQSEPASCIVCNILTMYTAVLITCSCQICSCRYMRVFYAMKRVGRPCHLGSLACPKLSNLLHNNARIPYRYI